MTPTPSRPSPDPLTALSRIDLITGVDYEIFYCETGFDGVCPNERQFRKAGHTADRLCLAGLCHSTARVCEASAAELLEPGSITLAS